MKIIANRSFVVACVLISLIAGASAQKSNNKFPKLTVEEVVKKHIESIGSPDGISAAKNRIFMGSGRFTSKIGYIGQLDATVQMASVDDKVLLAMIFNSPEYQYEKFGFDGKDVTVGIPGGITDVGAFIKSNKGILRKGLFGGSLSSTWPLLDTKSDLKLEYGGITEVGNRPAYKLKVSTGPLGDLSTSLYFDAETFQHVMTEYKLSQSPQLGGQLVDASKTPTYKSLTERFSSFMKAGKIVLPTVYVLEYTISDGYGTLSETFSMKFTEGYFDQKVDDSVFRVS
jgi:hypothetical protein